MNQNIYRVIYNTALACWQVASEHTASKGKTKSQATIETDTTGLIPRNLYKTQLYLSLAIAGLIGMGQVHAADVAGIVVDAAQTGNKPTVSIAEKNNVPVINITAPNAAGVSKNYFTDYNVPTQGIILNNTAAGSVTKLGGATAGNLSLGTQSASLIINQVTGTKSSLIANPYGITVNGSAPVRFINSSQVTLTTGRPTYTTAGGLDGYNVSGGLLRINGKGIDSKANARLDLIGRAASITSDIRADGQQLNLITGANVVKSDLSDITVKATTTHPAYAIDVSELGGMYAGQMNIIATEKGVGVNNKGYIALSQSTSGANASLSIDANGNLLNQGTISAGGGNTALYNRFGVSSTGTGSLNINTSGDINNNGGLMIGRYVSLNAGGNINNISTIKETKVGDVDTGTKLVDSNSAVDFVVDNSEQAQTYLNFPIVWGNIVKIRFEKKNAQGVVVKTYETTDNVNYWVNGVYESPVNSATVSNEMWVNAIGVPHLTREHDVYYTPSPDTWTAITTTRVNASTSYKSSINKVATIRAFGADRTQTYTTTDGQKIDYQTAPLIINAAGDVNLTASAVSSSGGSAKIYGNNINLNSVNIVNATNDTRDGNNKDIDSTKTDTGTMIHSANNTLLSATANINTKASQIVSDKGEVALLGDKIVLDAGLASHDYYNARSEEHDNWIGIHTSTQYWMNAGHNEDAVATQVIGDKVIVAADNGVAIHGSNVFGTNGVDMYTLKGDIDIDATQTNHTEAQDYRRERYFDFSFSLSDGIKFGNSTFQQTMDGGKTAYSGASIGSLAGNVNIGANDGTVKVQTGRKIVLDESSGIYREADTGVNSVAGDVNVTAKNIKIADINESSWSKLTTKYQFTGFKIAASSPILSAVSMGKTLFDQAGAAKGGAQTAAVGLSGALAGYNAYRNISALAPILDSSSSLDSLSNALSNLGSASISFGKDTYFNEVSQNKSTSQASKVTAGGTLNLTATGAGKAATIDTVLDNTGSDIFIQGSTVSGMAGTHLKADDDINIIAGRSVVNVVDITKTSSASIGVSASLTSGISVNASYNGSKGYSDSEEFINNEAMVGNNASQTSLIAGNDVNVSGSQVYGNKVYGDIGGSLWIRSLQDRYRYDSARKTFGVSLSVPIGGSNFSVGINGGTQDVNSEYKSVIEQAGIYSGAGGYDIKVGNRTEMYSGVIVSTAAKPYQNLVTKYLNIRPDIKNTAAYTANATSFGMTIGPGIGFMGFMPGLPSAMHASDNTEGKVHSTITGNVTTTGATNVFGGLNSIGDLTINGKTNVTGGIAAAGNLVINGDTTITDGGLYAKGSLTINDADGMTYIDNPDIANTAPTSVDTSMAAPLKQIFDLNKIQTGFDIATTLGQNLNEFRTIKAKDIDNVGKQLSNVPKYDASGNIVKDAKGNTVYITVKEAANLDPNDKGYGMLSGENYEKYKSLNEAWGNGGWGTIVLTSLAGAANGNVTGGTAQLVQNTAINAVQQLTVQQVKTIADGFRPAGASTDDAVTATIRAALQGITACGGAALKGQNCATAAGSAAATVALNNLFKIDPKTMTEAQKLAYSNLVQTIVTGVAMGGDANPVTAQLAGQFEVGNNGEFSGWDGNGNPIPFTEENRQAILRDPHYQAVNIKGHYATMKVVTPRGFGVAKEIVVTINLETNEVFAGVGAVLDGGGGSGKPSMSLTMGWFANLSDKDRQNLGATITDAIQGASISAGTAGCYAFLCGGYNKTLVTAGKRYSAIEVGVNSQPAKISFAAEGVAMVKIGEFK